MSAVDRSAIDGAISDLERLTEFYYNHTRGVDANDRYKDYRRTAESARDAMRQLDRVWPEFLSFQSQRAAAYDRYVTRDTSLTDGCSCHISAPCGFCTREADEEEAPASVDRSGEADETLLGGSVHESAAPEGGDAHPLPGDPLP